MDEFPDSDDEYDMVETHLYEAERSVAEKNIRTTQANQTEIQEVREAVSKSLDDAIPSCSSANLSQTEEPGTSESAKKRTYEELLNDIGDFGDDNFGISAYNAPIERDKRPRWDDPEAVIELILHERKKHHMHETNTIPMANTHGDFESVKDSISTKVPSWNFVALTRPDDSMRIYLRVKDTKNKEIKTFDRPVSGLISVPYSQLKAEAEEIIIKNVQRASLPLSETVKNTPDNQLWVDKYRPLSYWELLSDETVNRSFLTWIKLWDKVVFNREIITRKKPAQKPTFGSKKFQYKKQEIEGLDAKGFPVHRIVLLTGPPGLGKTTLAHLVAKQAGYNVVEINASDERGPDAFRQALLSSTQMRSLMGTDPRPNCLILDEIDGAPASSIDLLIKYVQGKLVPKGKKSKEESGKKNEGCKRPVVCICNEAYTPSLRALRSMAYVIPVPKVDTSRLADRLATIARREKLRADQDALYQLAEHSGCDVRSCLCALQYLGEACMNSSFHLGLKDTKRGLFDCWKDILQIPMERGGPMNIRGRIQRVLKASYSDDTERLAQGVFHNYPEATAPKMEVISKSLEWFQFYDEVSTVVMTKQDWRVMPYTNYAFVAWHFGFATNQFVKLSYPYAVAETNQKLNKSIAMLNATKRSYGRDIQTLALDVAPFISELLTPRLRSVSGTLYSPSERADLVRLINVMLDLGLSLVQFKKDDGSYDYIFDPNLSEIGVFPGCKYRRAMPYAVKQIVAQELELERLKRAAKVTGVHPENPKPTDATKSTATVTVPNHLRRIEPVPVKPKGRKYRNFFENFVPKTVLQSDKQKSPGTSSKSPKTIHRVREVLTKYGVWYKYKEGFSNSVRRDVKMSNLL